MQTIEYHPWVHRYALLTAAAAWLLPILAGALVTTTDAGMAFRDWPASDGHNLLLYPWLKSAGDKFLEHGHRLAGALIGVLSMGLTAILCWSERRVWVKCLGGAVLLCVILQGVLGGQRVLLEARGLAFLHGVFASWVFALMSCVALCTSRGWLEANRSVPAKWNVGWKWIALLAAVAAAIQYVLGGLVRHQGMVLYEHAVFALVVAAMAIWGARSAFQSRLAWLRRPAALLLILVALQVVLGLATYVAKFGYGNYVAQYGSSLQVAVRTAHVLLGMLVWMVAVLYAVSVWRIEALRSKRGLEEFGSEGSSGQQNFAGRFGAARAAELTGSLPVPKGAV